MKPNQHLRFVRITGGYAVHWIGCDCPDAEASPHFYPIPLQVPSASLAEAVSRLYRAVRITGPERFVLGLCAASVPLYQDPKLSWGDMYGPHMQEAAQAIWLSGQNAHREASLAHDQKRQRAAIEGAFWPDSAHEVHADIRTAYRAHQYARVLRVPDVTSVQTARLHADIIVTRAEIILGENLDNLLGHGGQHSEAMERAYAETERAATQAFVRELRVHLADVHALRALRSLVQ